jgi:2-octaprenyl-6-methoxyphenol hydroxylase
VDEHPQILVKAQHRVESVKSSRIAAQMTFRTADDRIDTVFSSLVVIAEGGKALEDTSAIRWSYQTSALSCLVESDDPVTTVAYERFTRKGPMALLPAAAGWAVIWTGPNPDIHRLIELNDQDFLTELQAAFGDRVGRLTATTPRVLYPLRAGFSLTTVEPRIVRIGNAAQTLHPVAGQGFNLGLRDVDTLVSLLDPLSLHDPGLTATLERYARLRTRDRGVTGLLTHVLAGGFTLPLPALRSAASLLFLLLDLSPQWKQKFSHLMADGVRP